ncbi:hypothetical protein [Flammeovirga sp. SJP92]|uniref:hypothetical protein n=1 Tax=Flammeovirga sp. SJP92 TaxID=1775430 RepID=UPI000787615D|nr:hypothetical protein [Flammeovirga sp. SJP92]KXX67408.1 hypothetical protein AVL50_26930 [Flammeovirga sp. SJP92]
MNIIAKGSDRSGLYQEYLMELLTDDEHFIRMPHKVTYNGRKKDCIIYFNEKLKFWYGYIYWEDTEYHWNAFGVCDDPFKENDLRIVCEINITDKKNGMTEGRFISDNDEIYLSHTGNFSRKKYVDFKSFLDAYPHDLKIVTIGGKEYIKVANLFEEDYNDFYLGILSFIKVVNEFKRS